MKKVKYIAKNALGTDISLTDGVIYDVIKYITSNNGIYNDVIVINDDNGKSNKYHIYNLLNHTIFQDVTTEERTKTINNILE